MRSQRKVNGSFRVNIAQLSKITPKQAILIPSDDMQYELHLQF